MGVAGSPRPAREGDDMVSTAPAPYYDPYDFEIDAERTGTWGDCAYEV